jgi:TP901 family phage tail tape measure protein
VAINLDAVLRLTTKVDGMQEIGKLKGALGGIEGAAKNARSAFTGVTSSATWQIAAVGAAAIGAGLASSIGVAMEFEKAMSGVQAKVGGTGEEIGELNKLARDLGRTTQFSASEAAAGMDFLAMAGFKTNEIVAAMPGLLSLAAAGNLELGVAADIASNILGGLGLEASEAGRVADVLAAAATSSNVSVEMLGDTFKYVAPVAAQAGVSLEELAAATGLLGDAGIQGSEAGTGLRSVLLRLAAPPEEAAKALDRLGISTKDSAGNMRPFGEILAEVDERMNELNLGTGEQLEIQNALFGKTAIASGAILQQAAATGKLDERTKELMGSQGVAAQMAETMNDNLAGAFKRLQSAIEGFQIELMSGASPAVQMFVDGAAAAINVVTDMMERFPILTGAVVALAAAFVALVALAPFIAAFISVIGSIKLALTGVGFATIVAGWQTVAIVAFAAIKTTIAGFLAWVGSTMIPALLAFFSGPVGWTVLAVAAVVAMVIAFREPIMNFFSWLGGAIADGLNALWQWGEPIRQFWVGVWEAVKGVVTGFFSWLGTAIGNGLQALWQWGEPIRQFWVGVLDGIIAYIAFSIDTVQTIASTFFGWVSSTIQWFVQAWYAIMWQLFVQPFINLWQNILREPVTAMLAWLQSALSSIGTFFNQYVIQPVSQAWSQFTDSLTQLMAAAFEVIQSIWQSISGAFNQYVVQPIGQAWAGLVRTLQEVMTGITTFFQANVVQPIGAAWNALIQLLPDAMRKAADFVVAVWTGLVDSVRGVIRNLLQSVANAVNSVGSMVNQLISAFNKLPGPNIPLVPTFSIPGLAQGGVVDRATLAVIGEGGEREYVVPESKMAAASSRYLAGARGAGVIPAGSGGGGGSGSDRAPIINITTGPVLEQQGERFVTVGDLESAIRQTATQIYATLRTPAGRRAIGVG